MVNDLFGAIFSFWFMTIFFGWWVLAAAQVILLAVRIWRRVPSWWIVLLPAVYVAVGTAAGLISIQFAKVNPFL